MLTAYEVMRARQRAREAEQSKSSNVVVEVVETPKVEATSTVSAKKKTDAEKLKKKKATED